jgi:hypothetical protein
LVSFVEGRKIAFSRLYPFVLSGFESLLLFSDATTGRRRSELDRSSALDGEIQQEQPQQRKERGFGEKKRTRSLFPAPSAKARFPNFQGLLLFSDPATGLRRSWQKITRANDGGGGQRWQLLRERHAERPLSSCHRRRRRRALFLHLLSRPFPLSHSFPLTCRRRHHVHRGLQARGHAPALCSRARPVPDVDVARQHEVDRVFEKDRLERAREVARLVDLGGRGNVGVERAVLGC